MNRVIQLQEISQVYSGYQFRNDLPELSIGDWKYIQMRDVDSDNTISQYTVMDVEFKIKDSSLDKYKLNIGDILFKNRGSKNSATLFNLKWPQAIASHQFLIIRTMDKDVLPEYLTWYINNDTAQSYFKQQAAGTTTLLIQKKTIEELEIIVPAIEVQKNLIEIDTLRNREKQLVKRRTLLRDKYIDRILSDCINNQRKI